MADLNDPTKNVTLWNNEKSKNVSTITDGAIERLAVDSSFIDSQITINPFPGKRLSEFLLNGTSSDMTVDGSTTPVVFEASPPTGKIWYIFSIIIVIEDTSMNFTKYGGLATLTNGVDFKTKEGGQAETIRNIKRNADYYTFVNELVIESSTTDILIARSLTHINSGTSIKLADSNSEYVKAVVNDNLTGIDTHFVILEGYEVDE